MAKQASRGVHPSMAFFAVYSLLFFGAVSSWFYFLFVYRIKRLREAGMSCDKCNKLFEHIDQRLVIATGRCSCCGERILSDD
jgi:hypothetical protein